MSTHFNYSKLPPHFQIACPKNPPPLKRMEKNTGRMAGVNAHVILTLISHSLSSKASLVPGGLISYDNCRPPRDPSRTVSICASVGLLPPPPQPPSLYTDYHNHIDISQGLDEQPFKVIKESRLLWRDYSKTKEIRYDRAETLPHWENNQGRTIIQNRFNSRHPTTQVSRPE